MPIIDLNIYRQTRDMGLAMAIGEHITLTRQNRGQTQEQLGKQTSCDRSVISRWETGALPVHPGDMAKVAAALHAPELLEHFCAECPVAQTYSRFSRKPTRPAA